MSDITIFWLIHLFVGLVLPIFVFTGCCRQELEKEEKEPLSAL